MVVSARQVGWAEAARPQLPECEAVPQRVLVGDEDGSVVGGELADPLQARCLESATAV
jgi:hypothetical protein